MTSVAPFPPPPVPATETPDWTPNWHSFQLFNGYRLILALLLTLTPWLTLGNPTHQEQDLLFLLGLIYITLITLSLLLSFVHKQLFQIQLSTQVILDILAITLVTSMLDGQKTGLGIILIVSIAGASLVAQGRLALFYAALASSSVLIQESFNVLFANGDVSRITQAGLLSLGFFTTAISAHLLGRRLSANEKLARRRGNALENQMHISRRIMERMQDGVLVVTQQGLIIQANPQALSILGEVAAEGSHLERIHPTLSTAYQAWRAREGNKRISFSWPEDKQLSARFARTLSSDGAALVFIEDLDQLREQAQQLKLASLGRLTASIAHEIRNPLSAISHAGDLLAEETEENIKTRLLRIIRDNTQRLDRVIQDVLILGRQRSIPQETIKLESFISEFVQAILAQEHLDKNVIQTRVPPDALLCFAPGQLHQILWNIVGNGLRHSSQGPGAVTLEVKLQLNRVELHIMDDGPGIPSELREQVFEPFFTTAPQGTGLGLHIARELSEANGTRLILVSEGPGAHFVLIGRSGPCQPQGMTDVPADEN